MSNDETTDSPEERTGWLVRPEPPREITLTPPTDVSVMVLDARHRSAVYVGLVTTSSARVDDTLTYLVGSLARRDRPRPELANGKTYEQKVNLVEALWPNAWTGRKVFCDALREAGRRRNALGHAYVDLDDEHLMEMVRAHSDAPGSPELAPKYLLRSSRSARPLPQTDEELWEDVLTNGILASAVLDLFIESITHFHTPIDVISYLLNLADMRDVGGWPDHPGWEADVRRALSLPPSS